MAKFGAKSLRILETVHPKIVEVLELAIKFYDFSVISGHRGQEEQDRLYRDGYSKKRFPMSMHNENPSLAVDIAPYPINWNDDERFIFLAGIIRACCHIKGVKLRWGGDWDSDDDLHDQTFMDWGHFELEA